MKFIEITDEQYAELATRTTGFGQSPSDVIESLLKQGTPLEIKQAQEGSYLTDTDHKKIKKLLRDLRTAELIRDQIGAAPKEEHKEIESNYSIAYQSLYGFLRSLKV